MYRSFLAISIHTTDQSPLRNWCAVTAVLTEIHNATVCRISSSILGLVSTAVPIDNLSSFYAFGKKRIKRHDNCTEDMTDKPTLEEDKTDKKHDRIIRIW